MKLIEARLYTFVLVGKITGEIKARGVKFIRRFSW
jgi:hypothetical protein